MFHDGLLVFQGNQGSVVNAPGEFPRPLTLRAEAVDERFLLHGRHVAQGVQAKATHLLPGCRGKGQQVNGVRREEMSHLRGNPDRPHGLAGSGRHVSRKLGLSHADAGRQVPGHRVQQGRHQPGLAAVHGLQTVQPHVGRTQFRRFHPVADPLQGEEHPVELPPVGRFIGFQNGPVGLAGQGLLQGHSGGHVGRGREMVDDQGPAPGAVNDDDGTVLQVGLPPHLYPGPQMGGQDAGDLHVASSRALLRRRPLPMREQ